jgi:hypothetical protein
MVDVRKSRKHGKHRSRAEADLVAAEYEASGLSRQAFCDQKKIPLKTLSRYVTRYRQSACGNAGPQQWVSVEVKEPTARFGELVVVVGGNRRIEVRRGFDVSTLQDLVRALEQF